MREILIIMRREFLERVRTRAFALGTLAFPLFTIGIMLIPAVIERPGDEKRVALVDDAPSGIGAAFERTLTTPSEDEQDYRYIVERVDGPFEAARAGLNARVQAEEIDGYVVLPATLLEDNEVIYRARNVANRRMLRDIARAASAAVQGERLRLAGLEGAKVAELIMAVRVNEAQVTATGEEGRGAEATFWYAYIVAFLIYFMTVLYGVAVMRSVLEEKTNRISEVMVSSVRAQNLMLGKILGVSSAAILQVAIWGGMILVLVTQSQAIAGLVGVSSESFAAWSIAPASAALFAGYFVLGFFLYAAIFAALGAAMTTEQEAQSMQMIVMIPLFVPLLFLGAVTNEPLGSIATTLGLIPLTAPITMPMRIATAPIPAAQIALSMALLALAVVLVSWLAGKIYRIGILATGRKATVGELVRWLREA
jgi:ABC-2 type transport system permease protein